MTEPKDGLLYMLAFCLLMALVMLLRSTPPPQKVATISKFEPELLKQKRG